MSSNWIPKRKLLEMFLSLLTIGLTLGFLVGLSLSPVVAGVLGSLLTVIISAVSLLSGIQSPDRKPDIDVGDDLFKSRAFPDVDVRPIAILCVALACGCCAGLFARSNDVFGARPAYIFARWQGWGLPDQELKRAVLANAGKLGSPLAHSDHKDRELGHESGHNETEVPSIPFGTGLYASPAPEDRCDEIYNSDTKKRKQLIIILASQYASESVKAISKCQSDDCVNLALETLCR